MTALPAPRLSASRLLLERLSLSNGLRWLHVHMPSTHSLALIVYVGLGSRYETDAEAGSAHLIEHMMFKGTASRRTSADISRAMDSVGGLLNASTDKEVTSFWARAAVDHLPIAVDLLSDMLLNSRFSPGDLRRERGVVIEELRMLMDDPQDLVHVLVEEALWPGQPVGREIAGSPESVAGIRRSTLLGYVERFYGANNSVIATAGGAPAGELVGLLEAALGGWKRVEPARPAAAEFGSDTRALVHQRPTEQVHLCIAFPGIPREDPRRPTLDVLCTILGGGSSSRLWIGLRDRLGLAYDAHAYTTYLADTGSIVMYAGADPSRLEPVADAMMHEIERLQRRRVPSEELHRTKQFIRGRLWLGLEDPFAVANWFGSQEILQHEIVTPEEAVQAVEDVSAHDLLSLAREIFQPSLARAVVVGPVADLRIPGIPN